MEIIITTKRPKKFTKNNELTVQLICSSSSCLHTKNKRTDVELSQDGIFFGRDLTSVHPRAPNSELDIITKLHPPTNSPPKPPKQTNSNTIIMSMFGLGRPQPSSAEKIAAAEQEMDLVTDMFNKYFFLSFSSSCPIPFPYPQSPLPSLHIPQTKKYFAIGSNKPA